MGEGEKGGSQIWPLPSPPLSPAPHPEATLPRTLRIFGGVDADNSPTSPATTPCSTSARAVSADRPDEGEAEEGREEEPGGPVVALLPLLLPRRPLPAGAAGGAQGLART